MDLDLTDEQQMLRDALRTLCEAEATTQVVRAAEQEPRAADGLKRALAEMGVPGLRIAPAQGGSGLGLTELVVAFIELGRALAPGAHFESGVVSAALLSAFADRDSRAAAMLTGIADGSTSVVTAWQEEDGRIEPNSIQTTLRRDGEGWRATGTKSFVAHAAMAKHLLLLARHPEQANRTVLAIVSPSAGGIEAVPLPNLADEPLSNLHFRDAPVEAVLGLEGGADAAWAAMFDQALVAMAALAVGGAEKVLEITVKYASEREQFGKPIGGFQAIAHYLADAAVLVEGARALVYRAASAADEGSDFRHFAQMAKLKAGKIFRDVSATAIQVHGGLGFTTEADPQLYYRRAKHQQLMYGDPAWLERRIGDTVLSGTHSVFA
ncbi:acyl-CoA dehydrogenase family protein [Sphingobium estronivorans]|uniref:acyl-CoA dehydrogenase family protein n=1 Tax=Sphingobium estronivorans TaxID=1577690 RepID=UPI0013C33C6D|nr:acyl-CoA dehydrogenase family protein [Sphingobium estronivorans]